MASQLVTDARKAWFSGQDISVQICPKGPCVTVTHAMMAKFGGPRKFSDCPYCTAMEWCTRVFNTNQFVEHTCIHPAQYVYMKNRCAGVLGLEWRHMLRNYNFALGITPEMPGKKCMFVCSTPDTLVDCGANLGHMIWRKRLSPYQTLFCAPKDMAKYNLKDFDFIILVVDGNTPIIPQAGSPPIFLYGHDHHPAAIVAHVPKLLAQKPRGLITPYPTIWTSYFKVPSETKVIFAPYLSDPMYAMMDANFAARPYDVFIVGTAGHAYPERSTIYKVMEKRALPFSYRLWGAPEPPSQHEHVDATKFPCPVLMMWSKFLTQARICVFGQDKWGYLVSKYAEILGATSLMVAPDIPDCKNAGLIANTHFIPIERPVETSLIPQLTRLVKHFNEYSYVAVNGLNWFKANAEKQLYNNMWDGIRAIIGD